jgi:hypothetical protein
MGFDFEGAQKRKEQSSSGAGTWKPKNGLNNIRVLPPTKRFFSEDIAFFDLETRIHFVEIEGQLTKEVFRCPKDKGNSCPACAAFFALKDHDDPAYQAIAQNVNGSLRFYANILDLDEPESGVQVYAFGIKNHKDFFKYIANPKWGNIMSPTEGRSFELTLTPKSDTGTGWPEYAIAPDPTTSDISGLLPDGWQDALDELENAVPDYIETAEINRILESAGVPTLNPKTPSVATSTPKTPPVQKVQDAEEKFNEGLPREVKSAPVTEAPQEPETVPEPEPEPVAVVEPEPEPEPVAEAPVAEVEAPAPVAKATPGGPEMGPDGQPVCFGEYDPDTYPCENGCPVQSDCLVTKLGLKV